MATPRKRWFKVADAVASKPVDNDVLAFFVRISAHLNSRWARDGLKREAACTAVISYGQLLGLAGCKSRVRAESVASAWATSWEATIERLGDHWRVVWPNFAEFQGLPSDSGETAGKLEGNESPPPRSASSSLREDSESEADAEPSAAAPETESSAPTDRGLVLVENPPTKRPPDVPPEAATFADDFRAALIRVHDGFKPPTDAAFESWRQEARRMLTIDKRPLDEARGLAAWLFAGTDEGAAFWRSVVLSVPKFREKYEQMKARASRNGGKGAAHHGSALLAWANS